MALTLPRWIGAALIGCAAIATWALRERPSMAPAPLDPATALFAKARTAHAHYGAAFDRLRLVEIRDSLTGHAPSVANGSVIVEDQDGLMSRGARGEIRFALAEARFDRPSRAVVPVEIAFLLDSAGPNNLRTFGAPAIDAFLPGAAFNDRCLVVSRAVWGGSFTPSARSLLGPCAYYEAFGPPGPRIDRWLRSSGWRFGHVISWRHSLAWQTVLLGDHPDRWHPAVDTVGQDYLGPRAIRCASGDVASCEAAVVAPRDAAAAPAWGAGIVSSSRSGSAIGAPDHELGPGEEALLSEMVRTLGPERFARFWHSDKGPADAFRDAAGVSLGQWTRDWVVRQYGSRSRGPTVNRAGFGLTGIILLVGLVLGFRAVQTRRVG